MTSQQQLQHLYWRAGFGPRPADIAAGLSPAKALRQLLRDAEKCVPIESPAFHYADPLGAVMAVPLTMAAPAATGTSAARGGSGLSSVLVLVPVAAGAAMVGGTAITAPSGSA
ncbi:MAG: hypothetical protein EOO59_18725 [Hymenobacter sp.]|nr:MAG: hypothetical protein EOO59_18725 [Hymenobacter sp.]